MHSYRRNADAEIRKWERDPDPASQTRMLRSKLRAGKVTEVQLQLAACLRLPAAEPLYPDISCGVGDGDRPTLTADGMVLACEGARLLGRHLYQTINNSGATTSESYALCATMCLHLLTVLQERFASQQDKLRAYGVLETTKQHLLDAWDVIDEHGEDVEGSEPLANVIFDNTEECAHCWEIESVAVLEDAQGDHPTIVRCAHCSPQLKVESTLNALRVRAAFVGGALRAQWNAVGVDESFLTICDAMLRVASYHFEVVAADDVEDAIQHRSLIPGGLGAVLLVVCRLHPDFIDTWAMAWDIINMEP